jgi:hypothetical protein
VRTDNFTQFVTNDLRQHAVICETLLIPGGKLTPCKKHHFFLTRQLQMEHYFDFSNAGARQSPSTAARNRVVSRRNFMRYLGVGAATLALEGCGGGGSNGAAAIAPSTPVAIPPVATPPVAPPVAETPPVTAPVPTPVPVWLPIPPLVFTQGVASSISIAGYVSASDIKAFSVSLNATPLPSGVTFNSATYSFEYDGRGSMATSDGHVLTAVVM